MSKKGSREWSFTDLEQPWRHSEEPLMELPVVSQSLENPVMCFRLCIKDAN